MKGYVCAHGERLIEGTLEIEKKIACEELPRPMGLPIFHIRHFSSIVRGAPPSVLELVRLGAENVRYGEDLWAGRGTLRFFPSEIEEHLPLAPLEILGAYHFSSGYRGGAASLGLGSSPLKSIVTLAKNRQFSSRLSPRRVS
jgi:Acetoacetate decarboxylase (ADC)